MAVGLLKPDHDLGGSSASTRVAAIQLLGTVLFVCAVGKDDVETPSETASCLTLQPGSTEVSFCATPVKAGLYVVQGLSGRLGTLKVTNSFPII